MRPERSTRSRKTSFPMSRRAMTRPARRLLVESSVAPASSCSAPARTAATSSRSGKRLAAMAAESSAPCGRVPSARRGRTRPEDRDRGGPASLKIRRGLWVGRRHGRALSRRPAARAGERADDLVPDLLRVSAEVEQDPSCDALVLAHEAEQDVLGADVVVAEGERFAQREVQHLLRARRERDLAGRDLVALADDPRDLRPHLLHGDIERLERPRRETLFLAEQPEQDVLGADVVVLERARLVLREDDDLASPLREPLEHSSERYV